MAGGGISIKSSCLLRFLLCVELVSGSRITGSASVGDKTKLALRTKDEAAMGEFRAGTNSSSAGGQEVLGTIDDDVRGCESIDDPERLMDVSGEGR